MEYYNYNYITGAATVVVAARPAFLHSITLNEALTGTVTVTDGDNTVAVVAIATAAQTLLYDVCTTKNLTVTTSAGDDITVSFKPLTI